MRIIRTAAALAAAMSIGLGIAGPAHAGGNVSAPILRLDSPVMCVRPDFPVTGSGWKVQAAVAAWNAAEQIVRLTTTLEPGCAVVPVHRYYSTTDGFCAYTSWDHVEITLAPSGLRLTSGADIYLNDACNSGADPAERGYTRHLIAHELGHAMGLPHSTVPHAVMNTEIWWPVFNYPTITPADVNALAALYRM